MRKTIKAFAVALMLAATSNGAGAEQAYLQATCELDFPEAMAHLQAGIAGRGYIVSRVQHVDQGLISRGYQTDEFKVVFFGQAEQMARAISDYPALIPFVPLSVTISRQEDHTVVSALAPGQLNKLGLPQGAEALIARWQQDVEAIIDHYRTCQDGI